jgi:hypothetical protein
MTTRLYLNGKPLSKAEATKLVGEKRLRQMLEEAKATFLEDPWVENDYMVPDGTLTIEFK